MIFILKFKKKTQHICFVTCSWLKFITCAIMTDIFGLAPFTIGSIAQELNLTPSLNMDKPAGTTQVLSPTLILTCCIRRFNYRGSDTLMYLSLEVTKDKNPHLSPNFLQTWYKHALFPLAVKYGRFAQIWLSGRHFLHSGNMHCRQFAFSR